MAEKKKKKVNRGLRLNKGFDPESLNNDGFIDHLRDIFSEHELFKEKEGNYEYDE